MWLIIFVLVVFIGVIYAIYNSGFLNTVSEFAHGCFEIIGSADPIGGARVRAGARTRPRDKIKDLTAHPRSKSEAGIIKVLEDIIGDDFPTVNSGWLVWKGKQLELDGYNEKRKLALEFSGPLHTKWFPEKEQYAEYFARIVRDVVKKRLCKKHGVGLIVVDSSLPKQHWSTYIRSRLYDLGFIEDKPSNYIEEQIAPVFRNQHIEAELGIECEYSRASAL